MSRPPRVRFAPSPTGQLHVGNARTALFNWLLARRYGGAFVLRIEDTDRERSSKASEDSILTDLRWLGLNWDEGPDVGGPFGPYRQSERLDRYHAHAARLLERGQAYSCFCTVPELEAERAAALAAGQPPKYSGRCRHLSARQIDEHRSAGRPAALRFAVPGPDREVTFQDLVRGPVTVATSIIGDPVIVRSDGHPAYNFAVVVDDAAMEITDVVRGEDHISNTPRQVLLYEALGLTPPRFAHLALVLGPDHAPLSKRHGTTSVVDFRERGFLPEALANYLALLGWSPGGNEEVLPLATMTARFEIERVTHSAAVFDTAKLDWMNREYLKQSDPSRIVDLACPYFRRAGFVDAETPVAKTYLEQSVLPMALGAVDRLEELPSRVRFLFDWDVETASRGVSLEPGGTEVVRAFAEAIGPGVGLLDREAFRAAAARARELSGQKGKALFHPLRVAVTGLDAGPELDLAVPAIDRGAALPAGSGVGKIVSVRERLSAVATALS